MNSFEANMIGLYAEEGQAWLNQLPQIRQKLSTLWYLHSLKPHPHRSYHDILMGFQKNTPIVVKIGFDREALKREILALQVFQGHGVIPLLDHNLEWGALLLERVSPGQTLHTFFPGDEAKTLAIATSVIQKLHQAPLPSSGFPTLADWLTDLDQGWNIPDLFLNKARHLKNQLLKTSSNPVLLHGDLHHDNILSHGTEWLAIDPKGVVGEAAYEVGAFIRNPIAALIDNSNTLSLIQTRTEWFAQSLGFDLERLHAWNFVQAVLAGVWALQDHLDPKPYLHLIEIFDDLSRNFL